MGDFSEVWLHDVDHLDEKLKDHGSVDILLAHSCQPHIGAFDMEERGPCDVCDRWSDLLAGVNYTHSESIHCISTGWLCWFNCVYQRGFILVNLYWYQHILIVSRKLFANIIFKESF